MQIHDAKSGQERFRMGAFKMDEQDVRLEISATELHCEVMTNWGFDKLGM